MKLPGSFLWLLVIFPAHAVTDAQLLVDRLSAISSYEADFTQVVQDSTGSTMQEASGHMAVQRPGLFYWYSSEPYEQELISNGDVLWVYDRDLEQAIKKRLDTEVGNTPALLLSGNPKNISDTFSIKKEAAGNHSIFYLSPLDESALFEVMRVTFAGNTLVEMYLEDGLGQKTVIDFHEPAVNNPVDSKLFTFNPPENTDLISEM